MGLLARLGRWQLDDGVAAGATVDARAALTLLGGGGDVAQVADLPASVAEAFGLYVGDRVSRAEAMRVPTVRRARQVICGTIGAQRLVAHRRQPDGAVEDVTDQRPLLAQPDPNSSRQHTLTWTVDDLFFHGIAWWRVLARDFAGFPIAAERVAPERVRVDLHARRVYIDGRPVPDADLLRFDGPDEGVLTYAGSVLGTSRLLDAAVRRLASGDVPLGALKLAEGATELSTVPGSANDGTDRSEVDAVLDAWEEARRTRSTAYLNRALDYQTFQLDARAAQLAEGRQQQRIDEANLCNVPPRIVNAPSASSLTYSNAQSERQDLVDTSLRGYLEAVEQRLSMGDVTPRGTTVRFDLSRYLQGDQLTALQAAEKAVQLQAMTSAEVRADVLGRTPLTDDDAPAPQEDRA